MNIGSSEVTLCCLMWVCGPSKQDLLVWSLGASIDPLGRFFMSSGNILLSGSTNMSSGLPGVGIVVVGNI